MHAFQRAANITEQPRRSYSSPLSPAPTHGPLLPHFQPRHSAPMIANTHNGSGSWGPAEVPHCCGETRSCRHFAGNAAEPGELLRFFSLLFLYASKKTKPHTHTHKTQQHKNEAQSVPGAHTRTASSVMRPLRKPEYIIK